MRASSYHLAVSNSVWFLLLWLVQPAAGQTKSKADSNQAQADTYAPSIVPPSPNAATLGRYGDLPVNLSNGLPNPNLTLFTEADKDLNWTVGLAYNYPGFHDFAVASSTMPTHFGSRQYY